MKRSTDRILTTHVGSLIRPPELQEFLRAKQGGKPYDEAAYRRACKESVAEVVRQQAEIGVDVVSDGEFGKSISWSQYVLERLSGFERRPIKAGGANPFMRGVDRERFAEFYAELDAREGVSRRRRRRSASARSPIPARPNCSATSTISKRRCKDVKVEEAFLPVAAPASVIPDRKNEYYKSEEELIHAIGDAMRTEYKMIVDAGFVLQLDDARAAVTYDRMVPPGSFADYRKWVALQVDVLNEAIAGMPAGPHPLSRLLGQLARPAHHRRAAEGHRRSHPRHEGRRLRHRRRQSAPRARMAGVGERQAAAKARCSFRASSATPPMSSSIPNWSPSASCGSPDSSGART